MHSRLLEVTVALVIGVAGATAAVWWFGRTDDGALPPPTTTLTESELGTTTGPTDPAALVAGLVADRTVDHVLEGTVERERDGLTSEQSVRRVRLGDRSIDRIGSAVAIVENGEILQCELDARGEVQCTPALTARTAEVEAAAIRSLFLGDGRSYDVFATADPLCWLLVAPNLARDLPYGRTSEICFDATEQIVVRRETNSRGNGSERYTVTDLSFDVSDADMTPN